MKDRSKLLQYFMNHNNGYMYFPDITFIHFVHSTDEVVKSVINTDTIQDDDQIIKVTSVPLSADCIIAFQVGPEKVKEERSLKESFLQSLTWRLPNFHMFNVEAVNSVYDVLVYKVCNTRIQEVGVNCKLTNGIKEMLKPHKTGDKIYIKNRLS